MIGFDHERLKVYQIAIQYIALADNIAFSLPRGRSYLADQLGRAALSIVLNIAEGAGEFSKKGKARFYRMALRSTTEWAAIMDVCKILGLIDEHAESQARDLLIQIVAILTTMVKNLTEEKQGEGLYDVISGDNSHQKVKSLMGVDRR